MAKQLKITWVKSIIGSQAVHRRTIRALGFHRLNETMIKEDTPEIRGMIHSIQYLLRVEEVSA